VEGAFSCLHRGRHCDGAADGTRELRANWGRSGWRVFVGQLPFYLENDALIRKHFQKGGCKVTGVRRAKYTLIISAFPPRRSLVLVLVLEMRSQGLRVPDDDRRCPHCRCECCRTKRAASSVAWRL
jgi:hypothetical protein